MSWVLYDGPVPYDAAAPYDPPLPAPAGPPTKGGDTWRYRFYQMQNGQPGFTAETHLFDLPVNKVTFGRKLGQVGQFKGTLLLSDPTVKSALLGQSSLDLLCDRTALYVELGGDLVWGGILQQVDYNSVTKQAQIVAQDWWGYFYNSRQISWNASYTAADQLYVAADLFNSAMGAPYANGAAGNDPNGNPYGITGYTPAYTGVVGGQVGVALGLTAAGALSGSYTSGVNVTQAWLASSFKSAGGAIADLGNAANGFDWTIEVQYNSSGVPVKTFNIWYPRAGRSYQTQQLTGAAVVFNMAGTSGQDYHWTTGNVKPANQLYGAGSGAGAAAIVSQASAPDLIQAGWPVLEDAVSYADVGQQAVLNQITQARLNQTKYPVRLPRIQYSAGSDSDQPLGSFSLGDDCRLIIPPDPYFQSGYDSSRGNYGETWWRVTQYDVTVADHGKSSMLLTFALPPTF